MKLDVEQPAARSGVGRQSFDSYGSTSAAAAGWEASWAMGVGWPLRRNFPNLGSIHNSDCMTTLMRTNATVLVVTTIALLALLLSRLHRNRNRSADELRNAVFTTTADWYKPRSQREEEIEINVPHELIYAVPKPLRDEATALLGDADIIPLSKEEGQRLSATGGPEARLQIRIDGLVDKLKFFQENPIDTPEILKRYGKHELEEQKQGRRRVIGELTSESNRLLQWKNELKPYLVKAVALQAGGSFSGTIISNDLVVFYTAMGRDAVPMERCPVVIFLPTKPLRVYADVGMIE